MSKVLVSEENLTNIANSIREKTGTTDTYKPSEMASAISGIQSGGGSVPERGIVINEFNSEGRVSKMTWYGSQIPDAYFKGCADKVEVGANFNQRTLFTNSEINLSDNVYRIGKGAFYTSYLTINNIPDYVHVIEDYAFYNNQNMTTLKIPSSLTTLGKYAFGNCINLETCDFGDNTSLTNIPDYLFDGCKKLSRLYLRNVRSVPTLSTYALNGTALLSGYIYVPTALLNSFKTATNWSTYADRIYGIDLTSIEIVTKTINTYLGKTTTINVLYNGCQDSLFYPEQEGYTLSVSGNATLDGNVLTLTDNAQVGDIITVTVTSNYDNSISSTQDIEIVYIDKILEVDLNNGQWIASGTTADNGNIIYKSNKGSYNIDNGTSTAVITVLGYTSVKLYIRSYAESSYDYTEAFAVDTTASRGKGLFTTKGNQSATDYTECSYELDDGIHTIEIMYSKDSGGNNNDDRGYFYIGECS